MEHLTAETILADYPDPEKLDVIHAGAKAKKITGAQLEEQMRALAQQHIQLDEVLVTQKLSLPGEELEKIRVRRRKFKKYLLRLVKQYCVQWFEERDLAAKPGKKYKSSFLRIQLLELTQGVISEVGIVNTIWLMRNAYNKKKRENLPLTRLLSLLKNEENGVVEVKKSLKLTKAIGTTICAFSNTSGGTIVIGLYESDKITPHAEDPVINGTFVLCGLGPQLDNDRILLTRYLAANLSLSVDRLTFELEEVNGRKVMIIGVPNLRKEEGRLIFYAGDAFVREDNHNRKLNAQEVYEAAQITA